MSAINTLLKFYQKIEEHIYIILLYQLCATMNNVTFILNLQKATNKISEVSLEMNKLEDTVKEVRIALKSKEDRVADLNRQRSVAESNRDSARRERNRQEREKEKMIGVTVGVGVAGTALTIATFGIAAPIAAAATTACGLSAAEHAKKEERANNEIGQYNQEISNINDGIASCRCRISNMESQIRNLYHTLQEHKQKCKAYEEDKKHIQEMIAFLQESQAFWGEFTNILELRSIKTKVLHQLLEKAERKENRSFLKCQGTQRIVMSFFDAWERLREELQSGASYIRSISFKCIQCKQEFTALPYMKDGEFVCTCCHSTIDIA